jgi:uncharacterized protein YfdQ (DUF2303 family)
MSKDRTLEGPRSAAGGMPPSGSWAADLDEMFSRLHTPLFTGTKAGNVDVPFVVLPEGQRVVSIKDIIDEFRERPERREGAETLADESSFVAWVNRFKSDPTVIFATPDRRAPRLTAIFDYHPEGGPSDRTGFRAYRAVLPLALSDEWKAWSDVNGKAMSQSDFAAFLEDRIQDVVLPPAVLPDALERFVSTVGAVLASPSQLIAVSRGLQVNVSSTVREVVTLNTGEINVKYAESHQTTDGKGAPLTVPNFFLLQIPVFYGGAPYQIPVRLRYRQQQSALTWSYHLYRPDVSFDHAFAEIKDKVAAATSVPVFEGTPEGA